MAEIPFEPYTGQGKLRFWCQKVLPLVYDDSLSYYELLGKVVEYLNNTIKDVSACEYNITALRDAFVQLQEYVNEMFDDFAPEIERIIDEMIDSGEFGEILSGVVNGLIANEYDESTPYVQFAYCLKDGKLYCATASTTGTWDETKWRETTVGYDMQLLSRRLYNLNAGQISYDNETTYDNGTVGKKLKDIDDFDTNLNAGQVAYNPESAYNNATVGKELQELKGSLNTITPFDSTPTLNSTKGVTSDSIRKIIQIVQNATWKDAPLNQQSLYFYEGASTATTYDLPTNYCLVVVYKLLSNRGYAIAYKWDSGEEEIWTNKLHDTWRGWVKLPEYPKIYEITGQTMREDAGAKTLTLSELGVTVPTGRHYFIQNFLVMNKRNNAYYQFPIGNFNLYTPDCWIMDRGTLLDIRLTASGVETLGGQPMKIYLMVI